MTVPQPGFVIWETHFEHNLSFWSMIRFVKVLIDENREHYERLRVPTFWVETYLQILRMKRQCPIWKFQWLFYTFKLKVEKWNLLSPQSTFCESAFRKIDVIRFLLNLGQPIVLSMTASKKITFKRNRLRF